MQPVCLALRQSWLAYWILCRCHSSPSWTWLQTAWALWWSSSPTKSDVLFETLAITAYPFLRYKTVPMACLWAATMTVSPSRRANCKRLATYARRSLSGQRLGICHRRSRPIVLRFLFCFWLRRFFHSVPPLAFSA